MFQLPKEEKNELVTNWHRFNSLKYSTAFPHTHTEHSVVMLASVLNSTKAVETSIIIVRAFIKLSELLHSQNKLAEKFKELEMKIDVHDEQIIAIFEVVHQLLTPPNPSKRRIGFEVKKQSINRNKSFC